MLHHLRMLSIPSFPTSKCGGRWRSLSRRCAWGRLPALSQKPPGRACPVVRRRPPPSFTPEAGAVCAHDFTHPGQAQVGTSHMAVISARWGPALGKRAEDMESHLSPDKLLSTFLPRAGPRHTPQPWPGWGSDTRHQRSQGRLRPLGGVGAGPRLPQRPGPPRLLSEYSPRAALPRVQPRTTPSRGARNPCTAKESSTAAKRLLLPTQEAFLGSRGVVSGT